jgi:hypothetical protein
MKNKVNPYIPNVGDIQLATWVTVEGGGGSEEYNPMVTILVSPDASPENPSVISQLADIR